MEWIISIAAVLAVFAVYVAGAVRAFKDDCSSLGGFVLVAWPLILCGLAFFVFAFKIAVFGA